MRLWSIHPQYLDAKGLVALWREALLAQRVLQGRTKGYKHHPQLQRFKQTRNPQGAIASFLRVVADEAASRGYHFDRHKIAGKRLNSPITVTHGQVNYEFAHLQNKLKRRAPDAYRKNKNIKRITVHPLFRRVAGKVAEWEIT